MFELTDRLEFRLNRKLADFLLDPKIIVGALENPLSISKDDEGTYTVVVKRLMGTKTLEVKVSADGDGGSVVCYDRGALRWSYFVKWWSLPGSATAELTLGVRGNDDGLRGRAKRLLEDLKVHLLNGDVEESYSRILGYFKGVSPDPKAQSASGSAPQKPPAPLGPARLLEEKA